MEAIPNQTMEIKGQIFEVVKPTRLLNGMVLKSGNTYARVGEKQPTMAEQIHSVSLFNRGFPVPTVLDSGELPDNKWYFTETSLGTDTFHKQFTNEYQATGEITSQTFSKYLDVVTKYASAQSDNKNKTTVSPKDFIDTLLPQERVLPNYCYFGYNQEDYLRALQLAADKLSSASMGVIQHDMNPFNVLENGVIDFELVGYGPVGFDTLMSVRWSSGWFTDYPSRCPVAYKLSAEQIRANDTIVDETAVNSGRTLPSSYMQEFLLLKSAWAASELNAPDPNWPADKLAFRNYRANVLNHAVDQYLNGKEIDFTKLSEIAGGELSQ